MLWYNKIFKGKGNFRVYVPGIYIERKMKSSCSEDSNGLHDNNVIQKMKVHILIPSNHSMWLINSDKKIITEY